LNFITLGKRSKKILIMKNLFTVLSFILLMLILSASVRDKAEANNKVKADTETLNFEDEMDVAIPIVENKICISMYRAIRAYTSFPAAIERKHSPKMSKLAKEPPAPKWGGIDPFVGVYQTLYDARISSIDNKSQRTREYIKGYADIAVSNMLQEGIPASITMAQAILESSSGGSDIAIMCITHFGKVTTWKFIWKYVRADSLFVHTTTNPASWRRGSFMKKHGYTLADITL
jgi:hypothetical protein